MVANDALQLREIAGAVHELWFYRDAVSYDRDRRRVVIPLVQPVARRMRLLRIPYDTPGDTPAGTLIFDGIEDMRIVDEAETTAYNVNRVVAEPCPEGVRITVAGGIPIHIEMTCPRVVARLVRRPCGH